MSPNELNTSSFSEDTLELFYLLNKYQVEFVIVGGYAVIYYGHLRLTGDIDIFFSNSDQNVKRLYNTLLEFWDGNLPFLKQAAELKNPDLVLQYGMPPNRIDLINTIDGIEFDEAWDTKEDAIIRYKDKKIILHYIGLDLLIKNKETIKRPRDIDDLEFLIAAREKRK